MKKKWMHYTTPVKKDFNLTVEIMIYLFPILYIFLNELVFNLIFSLEITIYKVLFTLSGGVFLLLLGNIFKNKKINFTLQVFFGIFTSLIYITQSIYYSIFSNPYVLSSLKGIKDAFEFREVAINSVVKSWYFYSLYLLLPILLCSVYKYFYSRCKQFSLTKYILLPVFLICFSISIILPLNITSGIGSARYLLLNEYTPSNNTKIFGVPVSMMLDLRYSFFEALPYSIVVDSTPKPSPSPTPEPSSTPTVNTATPEPTPTPVVYNPQVLDFDFNLLEENKTFFEMNNFFANRKSNNENEYTGMFEGKNLILITAEAFSDKLIDPELTPTLYKLYNEGFQFTNFYTPIWGVSTSDGEFVATTGLLPKSGVWSYTEIADNFMPFAFGNQFNSLGYKSYAFHNHTYTYYNRDKSYPTMGYEYYGKGNGLDITSVWPESDVELVEQSVPKFINEENFHIYMLTVSGHLEYNFYGNMMAYKNSDAIEDLEYSDAVRAYIACNLELEYALTDLLEQLETAGQLENTVIALSPDHYPYGLKPTEYAELYGKDSIDETFELFENGFLLWNSEMKEPIVIDKYCSSLDIAPTLSNLFNLDYDSRLYIGRDILSDSDPLVMFLDKSYITKDYMYNSNTKEVTKLTDNEISEEQIAINSQEVAQLFRYSGMIIENDYYRYLFDNKTKNTN